MATKMEAAESYDYVVVGGGSAGLVLANRLSEDGRHSVALIEAGGEAKSMLVQLPVGFAKLVAHPTFDWQYLQDPDPSIGGRRFIWSAGRLLGGSSSINGQVYIRGTRADFDGWAELGATGWSFADVLPYFMRAESWQGAPNQARGTTGPLTVSPMRDPHPLCRVFLDACAEFGIATLADYNTGDMDGAFLTVGTQRDGWRCSTEKAYLRPARSRPNLTVLTDSHAERLVLEEGRAAGVIVSRGGDTRLIRARAEIVLSAGAIGSPSLLMRSGIGPGAALRAAGIDVQVERAQVGENLQEHASVGQSKFVNRPTLNSQVGPLDMLGYAWRYVTARKGPFGAPAIQAMGLARTRADLVEPDIQLHFMPLSYDIDADTMSSASATMPKEPMVTVAFSLCKPKSRGRVALDAAGKPRIVHQLLGDDRDVETCVGGLKLVDRLFGMPAFRKLVTADRRPDPIPTRDEDWAAFARDKAMVAFHPVGSCRMGSDADAVVDPQLRVNGVGGLRVADASIMPTVTSGNTNAPTIMIGEKAAEMIRAAAR